MPPPDAKYHFMPAPDGDKLATVGFVEIQKFWVIAGVGAVIELIVTVTLLFRLSHEFSV
jgi:hypothetical protein